jgi:3-deoxy-manno-octulosonate cytidylyltransferase (CMP-KDO synthetase)
MIVGIIPARLAAARFHGKPLCRIHGKPMVLWVADAAARVESFDKVVIATCDDLIREVCEDAGYDVIMTRADHTRALDRVAEAARRLLAVNDEDIVVCVQGDEPMIQPDMLEALISEMGDDEVTRAVLCMPIKTEEEFNSPDTVKVVTDTDGMILYTSRAPIPYGRHDEAVRLGGMFAFTGTTLQAFANTPEHPLEIIESCDSNRICCNGDLQKAVVVPWRPYYAVDVPSDRAKVEASIAIPQTRPD